MKKASKRTVVAVAALTLALIPITATASSGFDDVPETNVFWRDVRWMAESGVTLGCNPPVNNLYCPDDYVTREQMAAFLHRLAINRVVDAESVGGYTADDLINQPGTPGPPGPPVEGPLNVHQSAFTPVDQSVVWERGIGRLSLPEGGEMLAPVVLPPGVTATKIDVWVLGDFDSQSMNVILERRRKTSGGAEVMSVVPVVGPYEAGIMSFADTTIDLAEVDNDVYWYVLRADFHADDYPEYDLGFYGVTIDYSIPE